MADLAKIPVSWVCSTMKRNGNQLTQLSKNLNLPNWSCRFLKCKLCKYDNSVVSL